MSRGKPIPVGPTARLAKGMTWEKLGEADASEIKKQGIFPYPSLPHPLHTNGGQVFPQVQTEMFPRLVRFDVEFDLPNDFLPEFLPRSSFRIVLNSGDVSRGQVVSLDNFRDLFSPIF